MAINISMTNTFRFTNPQVVANPKAFFIDLSQAGMTLPTPDNQVTASDASSGARLGGPAMIRIRPDQTFDMTDQQFATLVKASQSGYIGPTDFMNTLYNLVNNGVLQVQHDMGTAFTATQIFNFTA